jgi:medium-chain acyl-[acyl-carrier-protein] hydrolase
MISSLTSMTQTKLAPWFVSPKNSGPPRLRVFCLPYAGGSALIYRGWQNYLPAGVAVLPVQLPGRGSRYREPPYVSMPAVVSAVAAAIEPFLDVPFAFYGHSMGATMSFELAHAVRKKFLKQPEHLFVSGSGGPHLPRTDPNIHDLPDDQFIRRLKELNGTPAEVFENPELMMMMMRTLRADFEIVETYSRFSGPPLDCPITALGGQDDSLVAREELESWKIHTTNSFNSWLLPGDHFFLHTSDTMVLGILSQQIRTILTELG